MGKNTDKVVHAWRDFPLFRGIKIKPRWAVMQCVTKYDWKNLLLKFYNYPSLFLFSCHYSSYHTLINPADGLKLLSNKNFYTQKKKGSQLAYTNQNGITNQNVVWPQADKIY